MCLFKILFCKLKLITCGYVQVIRLRPPAAPDAPSSPEYVPNDGVWSLIIVMRFVNCCYAEDFEDVGGDEEEGDEDEGEYDDEEDEEVGGIIRCVWCLY